MTKRFHAMIRDVWENIRSHPWHTGLSFLAISIGVACLTVLISLVSGFQAKSRRMVQELGVNVTAILQQNTDPKTRNPRMTDKHLEYLSANFPGCVVSGIRRYSAPTLGTDERLTVLGTDHRFLHVRQWRMHNGRFLDAHDLRTGQRHAVISRKLGEQWNWRIGDVILLRHTPFRVVGTIEVGGSALETELIDSALILGERVVLVPKTVRPDWVTEWEKSDPVLDAIFVRAPASQDLAGLVSRAQRLLSQPDYRVEHISWVTPDSLIRNIKQLQTTIELTFGTISVLCLILGGATLMSLMVANVRQRVTEIGLRRALGATRRDIALLFVVEACVVTLLAGVTGTVLTHSLLVLCRSAVSVPIHLSYANSVIPLVIAVVLGAGFSCWPARAAASISPSEALRSE